MTNILTRPDYLQIAQLPPDVKERLVKQYSKWDYSEPAPANSDPRDPTWFKQHIDNEIKSIITALSQPNDPSLTQKLYQKLSLWGWLDQPNIAKYFKTNFKA
jgi:hypothetical protein